MNKIIIETAMHADVEEMAELLSELFTLELDFNPDRAKQQRGLRLILDNPALGRLFVARVGNRLAAMANALITVSTAEGERVLLLEDVIVRAEFRGCGYGRRLVEAVIAWAAEEGMKRVTLLADRDNSQALAFYRRLGFEGSTMVVLRRPILSTLLA